MGDSLDMAQPSRRDRSAVIVAFLSSGTSTVPSRALLVSALASARRQIAQLHNEQELVGWLREQARSRGVQENAAVLAALEAAADRSLIAEDYRRAHPDRIQILDELLRII